MNLADKLLRVHGSLAAAGIPHAFGGAIALAYWTEDPRGTRDIDINVFTSPRNARVALESLPPEVAYDESTIQAILRDAQARLWWDETPIDLFFSNLPIHDEAARHRREVPFEGTDIPVLAPLELALFKAMFDRTRDWADIEEMLHARAFDHEDLETLVVEHVGRDDLRLARLAEAVRRVDR